MKTFSKTMLAISTALSLCPASAFAQAAAGNDADANAEIIVTAQRREQNLQDVPISIAVATGDALRQSQVTSLNDLGNRLPSVKINVGSSSDGLNIRGIGSGFNPGFEQAVGLFLDGVYISRSQVTRAGFLDLERIEVLKGPQSTYFGANTIAGALSAVTRKPTQNFEGYASALYSPSDDEFDVQGAVGGPIAGGLSGRVAARFSGMNGYIYNSRLGRNGPHNRDFQARGALRYEVPGELDVNFRLDYSKYNDDRVEGPETINCPPPPGSPYGNGGGTCVAIVARGDQDNKVNYKAATGNSGFNIETISPVLTAAYTFGNHTLTSQSSYYHHKLFRIANVSAGPVLSAPVLAMPSGLPLSQPETFRSFSQELRLQSDKGEFIDYMVGLFYDDTHLNTAVNTGFYFADFAALVPGGSIPAGTPIAQEVIGVQDQSNRSAFAAVTVNATEAFRINLGARYTSIKKENHRSTREGVGDALGQVVQLFNTTQATAFSTSFGRARGDYAVTTRTDDKFMPSINVQFDATSDVMLYASYSTGFKAGGWNIGQNKEIFDPETVKSYEAGIKATWLDRRVTTNLTIFSADYDNLQESTFRLDPNSGLLTSTIANVAKARSRGVEFELGIRPVSGLSLSANVGYVDAKYRNYTIAGCTALQNLQRPVGCTQDLSGRTKAFSPKWSGSVSGNYSFAVSDDLKAKLGAWMYFSSGFYQSATIDPLLYQSSYAKLDLRASIGRSDDRWEFAVIGKNVTDKVTGSFRTLMVSSRAVNVLPERPRSIAFQLSTKF